MTDSYLPLYLESGRQDSPIKVPVLHDHAQPINPLVDATLRVAHERDDLPPRQSWDLAISVMFGPSPNWRRTSPASTKSPSPT